jgi:TetR/AcrR family transcriptional repressor of nem operon
MLLFAAMLGTGMISRAMGDTAFTQSMQAAVLAALPGSESD